MADFLSPSSVMDLEPETDPSGIFQDSSRILQQLTFLENLQFGGDLTAGTSNQQANAAARNSMKTLKCPKCNWHYKYQEALENHLKDKHPDVEITCIFCIQNLAHPKLARGESYSCGYKPFRCEICNYSTTTKGNLSIHMQSDKHLHAIQDMPGNMATSSSNLVSNEAVDDRVFQCLICGIFTTDSLEKLFEHLNADRSQTNPADVTALQGVFQCLLCPYSTNLKANFQLHTRTDKHLQRVQMINHMREGTFGSPSAASNLLVRLSAAKSGVQIRCRPCCEIFSSPESIQEHSQTASHLSRSNPASFVAVLGLNTNDEGESAMDLSLDANGDENLFQSSFQCRKCSFTTCSESQALAHCDEHETDLNDVLSIKLPIKERIPEDQEELEQLLKMNQVRIKCEQCPTNSFLADSLETLENHFENHESQIIKAEESKTANCPLCDELKLLDSIEAHLIDDHKIAVEKARKLMESVLDCGHGHETSPIYKFHCAICPMVFKNRESYQKHALRHLFERCHKCSRCGRSFKTEISLKSHLSTKHGMHNVENLNENRCSICDETFSNRVALQNHIYTIEHLHKAKKFLEDQNQEKLSSKINDQVLSMLVRSDDKPYRCNVCRLSYGQGSTLDIHLRSVAHQTRIGRLSELLAAGEVDPCLPVSEQPGGLPQKTIGELVLPATKNELEKLQCSESMNVVSASTSIDRKRKLDADPDSLAAFRNIMNVSHLLGQIGAENAENTPDQLNQALASMNPAELQNLLMNALPQSSTSTPSSSARESPVDDSCLDLPKTGRELRKSLEYFGLELVEQFFDGIHAVKDQIDRLPDSVIAEISKVDCPNCNSVFPSLWILKDHAQEVHSSSTPLESVQQFSEKLKSSLADLEDEPPKKQIKSEDSSFQFSKEAISSLKKTNGTMSPGDLTNPLMMSMMAGNFPMMMNPFLSMMTPEALTSGNMAAQNDLAAALGQQRRARTKITDDQLKVLKQYFDINNSPTEQQVKEMSIKTGLAEKVIKHWFRNTLFKERQRDKDSPYNFNVPPQLSIDLDTYEKTGEAKIKALKTEEFEDFSNRSTPSSATPILSNDAIKSSGFNPVKPETPKIESKDNSTAAFVNAASDFMANLNKAMNNNFMNPFALFSQMNEKSNSLQNMLSQGNGQSEPPAPQQSGNGRRANRTRFTDHQLRTLQQFFDKQAYPKDDDLEMLSKKLNLSPRVIVVWFQNARQKARKIYENTPNLDNNERFIRTPGQNFQCKRCNLVFPRYYELIQHQQKVCYVNDNDAQNNDNKGVEEQMSDEEKPTTSYEAGGTATVTTGAPLNLDSEDKNPMETLAQLISGSASGMSLQPESEQNASDELMKLLTNHNASEAFASLFKNHSDANLSKSKFFQKRCPFCGIVFNSKSKMQEHLPLKHAEQMLISHVDIDLLPDADENFEQALDLSNVSQSPNSPNSETDERQRRDSSFLETDFDFSSVMSVSPNLPSMLAGSLFGGVNGQQRSPSAASGNNQNSSKRYRTHLTPLQVYVMKALFNDYKTPSMAECDMLGNEIGLNKRVVQVWFQNARAKERKCRSVTGDEDLPKTSIDGCSLCGVDFANGRSKTTMQDHIFTKRHISLLSEKFNARGGNYQGNEGSASPPILDASPDRPRAKAVRDTGIRKNTSRPDSAMAQFPFSLMCGLPPAGGLAPFMYDPAILGTSVAALQIPPSVMQQIASDIQSGKDCSRFTQDGLELADLRSKISDDDFKLVTLVSSEVGYACRNCSNTFQQQLGLEAHQKLICPGSDGTVFKLLQNHYECIRCNVKTGTQEEFKKHTESQTHRNNKSHQVQSASFTSSV